MKNSEILKQAKQLIINPQNWMQGDWCNDDRTCFCGLGAIAKTVSEDGEFDILMIGTNADDYLRLAALKLDPHHDESTTFAPYNDSHTHEEVLHAFDVAIQLAEAEEV